MMPHHNSLLGFGHKKRLSLPTFDRYFLITPGKGRPGQIAAPEEDSFVGRLTESAALNSSGIQSIRTLVQAAMERRDSPPIFTTTMPGLSQNLSANKLGTNFTGTLRPKQKAKSKTTVVDVLETLSDGSTRPAAGLEVGGVELGPVAIAPLSKAPKMGGGGGSY